jgi:hypothetical protein
MTRKDFQAVASMIGDAGRLQDDDVFRHLLDTSVSHMKGMNANFKEDVFRDWAHDVRNKRRDIDGRKR